MHSKSPAVAALKAAFPHTIPIFAGFLFLGMTYGVYMRTSGFSFWYPMIMSVVIFGGVILLVIVIGEVGVRFSRYNNEYNNIKDEYGITNQMIKDYLKSNK